MRIVELPAYALQSGTDLAGLSMSEILDLSLHEFAYRIRRHPVYGASVYPRVGSWQFRALLLRDRVLCQMEGRRRAFGVSLLYGNWLAVTLSGEIYWAVRLSALAQSDMAYLVAEDGRAAHVAWRANVHILENMDDGRRLNGVAPFASQAQRIVRQPEFAGLFRGWCQEAADLYPFASHNVAAAWREAIEAVL